MTLSTSFAKWWKVTQAPMKSNASINVVALKQQHSIQWEINAYFTLKIIQRIWKRLFSERKLANKPTAKCVNDIFSVFEFSKKKATQAGKYIEGHSWINKQQHCVQCEIKKLKIHHDYITDLKALADLMFIVYPK